MGDDRTSRSWLARLAGDPIRLRRRARIGALVVTLLSSGAYGFVDGPLGEMVVALSWITLPALALAIGIGDAFFLRHGQGQRRIVLQIAGGAGLALMACVALAEVPKKSQMWPRDMLDAIGYAIFYATLLLALAGLVAMGLGRSEAYLARRIGERGDDDW
jgi:hypothetical protein